MLNETDLTDVISNTLKMIFFFFVFIYLFIFFIFLIFSFFFFFFFLLFFFCFLFFCFCFWKPASLLPLTLAKQSFFYVYIIALANNTCRPTYFVRINIDSGIKIVNFNLIVIYSYLYPNCA